VPSPFYIYFNFRGVTMPTLELDPNKKYTMPHPVITVAIDNKFLAIARETGNWVLLENNRQREIFDALKELSDWLKVIVWRSFLICSLQTTGAIL